MSEKNRIDAYIEKFVNMTGWGKRGPETLAELMLDTPKKEKIELLRKAAHQANEDQRATFRRAQAVR